VRRNNIAPALAVPALALLALPLMAFPGWITLSVAGIAMGMMLFLMASGLTLIFGLMDVLNFAHGGFITLGAFLAASVFAAQPAGWPPEAGRSICSRLPHHSARLRSSAVHS
jgi:branched-chain amino acid transport system permease protein